MKSQFVFLTATASAMLLAAGARITMACGGPPPTPPPQIWVINHGINEQGNAEQWVGIELDLFATQTVGTCACGLGFSSLPASAEVTMAGVGVTDPDHNVTFLDEFQFEDNGQTTDDLNSAFGGGNWFGFTAENVPPIDPSSLPIGPGDVVKLWFKVEFDRAAAGTNTSVTFASGEGLPGGGFDPSLPVHGVTNFTSQDGGALELQIPEPTTLALAGLVGGCWGVARRRR